MDTPPQILTCPRILLGHSPQSPSIRKYPQLNLSFTSPKRGPRFDFYATSLPTTSIY